ncbi:PLP-dependent aminotransferase family protein [Microbulbifer sp. THAF38]|uniref:aminotransferase-like domain-containing protein n=1 Tax=Microbulbifer sp. THAF38 TaxID=2587856 RepID=UPI0012A7B7E6|nr:PLP-dependent aminotransferase family protein [Microbulbifer sp. THAF38]QFT56495.1 putative HTH-type transcriptional regulator YdcR [Microbulbifer sp. THAF38]
MRYKILAKQFINDIQQKRVQPGQRLPSLRSFAAQQEVSLTTAVNCYRYLEELGWVRSRPKSGFFASEPLVSSTRNQSAITKSSNDLTKFSKRRLLTNSGPLGISLPAIDLLPTEALQRSMYRSIRDQGNKVHFYPDPLGEPHLRQALSRHFSNSGFNFSEHELVISNGCLDAVRIAVEVTTKPGDTVAVCSPCFTTLIHLLVKLHRKVLEIPMTEKGIDLEQLEQHMYMRTINAGLFNCSNINPTGISLCKTQKQKLANLATQYQIPIIEDDIYIEISHQPTLPLPVYNWDQEGYILWCSSVSKTLAAGYRVGWCLPGRYLECYQDRLLHESLGVSTSTQLALADFISSGQYARHLNNLKSQLNHQVNEYRHYLIKKLPNNVKISAPQGGLVLWVQVPGLNCESMVSKLQAMKVDIRLGQDFSTQGLYQEFFRINCGWPLKNKDGNISLAGQQLEKIIKLIHELI